MPGARPFSSAEQAAWLRAARNQRDRTFFLLGIATGLRCSELLSLRVRHVWAGNGPVEFLCLERRLQKNGRGPHRRSVHTRSIPLHPVARAAIQTLVQELFPIGEPMNPHAFLFASNRGRNRPLTRRYVHDLLRETAFAAGIPLHRVSTHSLRKTLAAQAYQASGHDLIVVKEILQHRSIETTWRYLDLAAQKAHEVQLQLDLPDTAILPDTRASA